MFDDHVADNGSRCERWPTRDSGREVCVQPAVQLGEWLLESGTVNSDQRTHSPQLPGIEPVGLAEVAKSDLTPQATLCNSGKRVHQ